MTVHCSDTIAFTIAPNRLIISKMLPYYNSTSHLLTKVDIQVEYDYNVSWCIYATKFKTLIP